MSVLALVIGPLLLVLVGYDIVRTTLSSVSPAGPISGRLLGALWRVAVRLYRRGALPLPWFGSFALVFAVGVWVLLGWAGWTLVFVGVGDNIIRSTSGVPASLWERVYFAGYTLFTLGVGDYRPVGALWQIVTAGAAGSGLLFLTLSISYLVGVTNAASERRRLAGRISALGGTPEGILVQAWHDQAFKGLTGVLPSIEAELQLLAQRHLAYPVLHYQRSHRARDAAPARIAALDEALTLLTTAVDPRCRPPRPLIEPTREAIAAFLTTLSDAFLAPTETPPPAPSLDALRTAGIPTVDDAELAWQLENLAERRKLLGGLVEHGGWSWPDVQRGQS